MNKDEVVILTDEMRDGFDFKKGQIIVLGCSVDEKGNNEFELPAIVTKVHERDENGHYQYDYIFPLRGACEFVSWGEDKKRYLWRFHRKEVVRPPTWFLTLLKQSAKHFHEWDIDLAIEELFYIDKDVANKKDMFVNYPFRSDSLEPDEITKEEKAFCLDLAENIKFYDLQKQFKKLLKKKKKKCTQIEGKASFGEIVEIFRILDRNFNHAFTAGMGASWNDDGKLMSVDGMALFKHGYFETHPYINHSNGNGYLLRYEGNLFEDTYKISVLRVDKNKTIDDIASRVRRLEDKEPMHEIKGEVE